MPRCPCRHRVRRRSRTSASAISPASSPAPARRSSSPRSAPRSSASRTRCARAPGTSCGASPPYVDDRRGINLGGAFNNHNVEKLGITIDLRQERGKELLRKLVAVSDAVTENFAAGVFARMGFSYDELRAIKPDIIYVSNCGFGASGPYSEFTTWGPIVQAVSGLTFSSGLPDQPPAGWGFSYMDHMGANFMAVAILAGLIHRNRTGEGQWIDMACTEAGVVAVRARPPRLHGERPAAPAAGSAQLQPQPRTGDGAAQHLRGARAPTSGSRSRVATTTTGPGSPRVIDEPWATDAQYATLAGRLEDAGRARRAHGRRGRGRATGHATAEQIRAAGVPASVVASPEDRIDHDPGTSEFGLWPIAHHTRDGRRPRRRHPGPPLRDRLVDRARRTVPRRAHRRRFRDVLGLDADEIASLHEEAVV